MHEGWSTAGFCVDCLSFVFFVCACVCDTPCSLCALADIPVFVFVFMYAGWKIFKRTSFVQYVHCFRCRLTVLHILTDVSVWTSLSQMDFETGRRELDDMSDAEAEKQFTPTTYVTQYCCSGSLLTLFFHSWYQKVWAAGKSFLPWVSSVV